MILFYRECLGTNVKEMFGESEGKGSNNQPHTHTMTREGHARVHGEMHVQLQSKVAVNNIAPRHCKPNREGMSGGGMMRAVSKRRRPRIQEFGMPSRAPRRRQRTSDSRTMSCAGSVTIRRTPRLNTTRAGQPLRRIRRTSWRGALTFIK